ncbi:MAG: permease-like cell division protein FtsX [Deltaproteobacteria bacterium]|jgi:cell division transport system permease protein|nr:permease-like cell division protein FtsX [Deltaproteobacteria bacterium]MDH3896873.1 permease-like cell division protein FtsX [Deltaproteobacteria bacterium]MDH3927663.1 permease-like cell division protein FtsX [Deltaproteobacteria bacterium]MDH3949749.1 permease-like cell division protein FtsX [Deltaproteobacteria bacterium]PNV87323.1 MAG: ABC transporter permease [Desulfobacteraceae bacterium]
MRIGLLVYFLRKALENIWTNPFLSLVTLSTIAISMLILGLFSLIYLNVQQSLHQMGGELQITAYLQETISSEQAEVLRSKVADWPEVEGITYISKEQALARFRSQLREYAGILEGLKENPLPASLELTLMPQYGRSGNIKELSTRLGRLSGVAEVQYGRKWMAKLRVFVEVMKLVGITVGGLLLIATIFVISNTIKLTFYSRREELEIMRLVGATDFFIKAPFLIEGLLHGLGGALLAAGGLSLLILFLFSHLDLPLRLAVMAGSLPTGQLVAGFLGLGLLLGVLGSMVSLRRFLRP